MNGVIGMTSLLLNTDLSDEQREFARMIQSSAETLLTLLNDILDLSKIEAGKLELEETEFEVNELAEEIGIVLAPQAQNKNLEFICAVSPEVPPLLTGDPLRLRQVIINLAGNAIKFTDAGEVVIDIQRDETAAADEQVSENDILLRVTVRDTGIGIPRDRLDRLFKDFSQVDQSTSRKYGGTGLGLAISARLVEMMGGTIEVDSQEGVGTQFTFTARLEAQPGTRTTTPAVLRDRHVLIVDDNHTNRLILQRWMEALGCRHAEAASGERALDMLRHACSQGDPYDLALLDMRMPGLSGLDVARAVHDDAAIHELPLLLLTSEWDRDWVKDEDRAFTGVLPKPVKHAALVDAMARMLTAAGEPVADTTCIRGEVDLDGAIRAEETHQAGGAAQAPATPPASAGAADQVDGGGRILLVEDNQVNQRFAITLLKRAGLPVDVAGNGQEGVEAVEQSDYVLILMDIQMPEMDGITATKIIRQLPEPKCRTPIIALTAHAMKGDRERFMEAGMDDYLSKPIDVKQLMEKIERWKGKESRC
jgi:CheY-like chemotaxis protein